MSLQNNSVPRSVGRLEGRAAANRPRHPARPTLASRQSRSGRTCHPVPPGPHSSPGPARPPPQAEAPTHHVVSPALDSGPGPVTGAGRGLGRAEDQLGPGLRHHGRQGGHGLPGTAVLHGD